MLHRYRRGHGFKSRIGLIFFRPYLHYCLGSVHYCKDRFHSSVRFSSINSRLKLAVRPFLPAIICRFHIKPLVVLLNQRSWNYFNFFSLLHCQFAWLVLISHMRVLRKFVTMVVGDLSVIGTGDYNKVMLFAVNWVIEELSLQPLEACLKDSRVQSG